VEGIRAAVACSGRSIALDVVEVGHDLEAIRDDLVGRLAPAVRPQALFTLTNTITLGALGALLRCGLAVPRDVSLIGFDDYEWMRVASPPITTVRQPAAAMSRAAWE